MLKILGYPDRFSVRPGETIRFMVSSELGGHYTADFVRIVHGDVNPDGPGYKEIEVKGPSSGTYSSRIQQVHPGSSVVVADHPKLANLSSFHVQCMVWPTLPTRGEQGLIAKWSPDRGGFALILDETGAPALRLGNGDGGVQTVSTGTPLIAREWYRLDASFDADKRKVVLRQIPLFDHPSTAARTRTEKRVDVVPILDNGAPLTIGAWFERTEGARVITAGHYDGKIDAPRLLRRPFNDTEAEALAAASSPNLAASVHPSPVAAFVADIVAAWDFSQGIESTRVHDVAANRLDGTLKNLPTRAAKGHNWTGEEMNWRHRPDQYGAIHFHHDDLYDAGWEPDFELTVPADWRSGSYAARLTCGAHEEYIPFFVIPPRGRPGAKLAFLVPTASYMAYANEHLLMSGEASSGLGRLAVFTARDMYVNEHREIGYSLYDYHADGSGVCYSSRLRPVINMRPKYQFGAGMVGSSLHQYNADTHIIDWLEAMGHAFDVITDEDLHNEGMELLSGYRAVMTGTHPEYYSTAMLDALHAFKNQGGRLIYMGGNGFYWRIAFHQDLPGVIEVRRAEGGIRTWMAEPGEYYHSFTGEYGGIWLRQGRPPQTLCGVGFTAQGFDISAPYKPTPDSRDPRAAFIFDGIPEGAPIGDTGLVGGAAGGFELDRADRRHGTPPHALVLATTMGGHTDTFLVVPEELHITAANITGTSSPLVRADMVFYETPGGGAVFSTGSIAFAGSLSPNGYRNNASRMIDNVVRRFVDDAAFVAP
ncbi:MAG: N,N-dimethylformamidase [Alphaproteobacteria bacterium]